MRTVCDTGPLVAAANVADEAHGLAAALVSALGRDLVVPTPVAVEVDHVLRARVGGRSARLFLSSLVDGEHRVGYLTATVLHRAVAIDARYEALGLGFADGAVMAYAERFSLPILTFDFAHFRATKPARGYWRLVVDESRYLEAVRP